MSIRRFICFMAVIISFSVVQNAETEERDGRRHYGRGDLPKRTAVVKTPVPPVIDGIMESGEWDSATLITGLTEAPSITQHGVRSRNAYHSEVINMAADQSYFWITYDDDNLYIAHHSPPPERIGTHPAAIAVMLKRTETRHDAHAELDDSIYISFVDPVYPGGDKYVVFINDLGTTFDCIWNMSFIWEKELLEKGLGNEPGVTIGWDPMVESASSLTEKGWYIEVAMPWDGLGPHIKRPGPGEVKYMNFGRVWQEVMNEGHAWKVHDEFSPAGEILFQGEDGIIVNLRDTGNTALGKAFFKADIKNLTDRERYLYVEVAADTDDINEGKDIRLRPGESYTYEFLRHFANIETGVVSFAVSDKSTAEVLHKTALPVIRPSDPVIYTRRYRSHDMMKFETDISFIGMADLRRTSIGLTLVHQESGRRVFRRTFRGFTSYQPVLELSTKDWAPGIYAAHFSISAPGMSRYETSVEYYHPELPEWWDNNYGYDDLDNDRVPYPWTDIKIDREAISVWGREYDFTGSLLPVQVTTLDLPMLRAPMRIFMETGDGEIIDTSFNQAEMEWNTTDRTRVEGTSRINSRSLSLINDFWVEYDGLVWNSLTIEPKERVDIAAMYLEIPLTSDFTDVINPRDYTIRNTGKIKPEGFTSTATTSVWLGNADGGLQWFCETDGWFFLEDFSNSLDVSLHDSSATLRINMIDIVTGFNKPHTIEFGFIATPVRPKTWRTPEHPHYRDYPSGSGMFWDNNYMVVPGAPNSYSGLYVATQVTNPAQEAYRLFGDEWRPNPSDRVDFSEVRIDRANWVPVTMASKSLRDYYVWAHWYRQHKHNYDYPSLRWSMGGKDFRGYAALYYDVSGVVSSANQYVGTGYKRRDGTTVPTVPILAERDVTRRLYNITLSNPEAHPRDSWIGYHYSGEPHMAFMGFANENWNAENLNSAVNHQQQTYRGLVDPAVYRAEYLGHNFGWPVFFLGQGRISRPEWVENNGGPEAVFDHISGLDLLHDGKGVCCILPGGPNAEYRKVRRRMEDAVKKHNLRHWKFRFIPYWQQDIVQLPSEDMYASFYLAHPSRLVSAVETGANEKIDEYFGNHLPLNMKQYNREQTARSKCCLERMNDKAVIIIYNDSDWEGEMRLKPDWEMLGLGNPKELKAENAVHSSGFRVRKETDADGNDILEGIFFERPEEFARIEGEELVFPMTGYNYRMLVIEKNK